jgi:hypothetical protein
MKRIFANGMLVMEVPDDSNIRIGKIQTETFLEVSFLGKFPQGVRIEVR